MTYLSRVWLNPLRTGTQRLLSNPQATHAAVLGGVPAQPVTERVLWRLEATNPHRGELIVLTATRPSWEHLVEQAGWPGAEEPQAVVCSYKPLLDRLVVGQCYALRVRANPLSTTRRPTAPTATQQQQLDGVARPRGVRVAHRTARHQLDWFVDRVARWGFTLLTTAAGDPQLQLAGREQVAFTKSEGPHQRRRVTLTTATFDAHVQVSDPTAARAALLQGVGGARAYGCGLITLAPTRWQA